TAESARVTSWAHTKRGDSRLECRGGPREQQAIPFATGSDRSYLPSAKIRHSRHGETNMSESTRSAGVGARAIHAGQRPEPTTGAIMTPVYQTSTYVQPELGRHTGYEYARTQNPTREALEANVADLEDGQHGLAFASGSAALDTLSKLFSAGDHIVCGE